MKLKNKTVEGNHIQDMEYGLTKFSCIISTKSQSFQFGNPNICMYLDNNYLT